MERLISSNLLDHILECAEGTAHIKDACTKKYIRSNEENLKIYNFKHEKEMIGATAQDLDDLMQSNWDENFIDEISELDNRVIKAKQVYHDEERLFLNRSGILRIQHMTKYPVINSHAKVTAILTLGKNVVYKLPLITLYEAYLSFYEGKSKCAIPCFLRHTGVEKYFREYPTHAELRVLIAKKIYLTHKHIANALGRSVKTIDIHLYNLNSKIQFLDLVELAAKMENSI